MNVHRGDVVIVDFYPTDPRAKVRPALVVQNDRDNARMQRTIVVQITSNVGRSHEDTQYLIDSAHSDWAMSGLRVPSAVNAANLATVARQQVTHVIGGLSVATMQQINACLRAALGL
jgi:mRNA-degrading endonuclease toxin of MazEF toxin-antitoxin module